MLVGEVQPERSPAARDSGMLSAARPVLGSVIATRLAHVSTAQRCTRVGSTSCGAPLLTRPGAAGTAGAASADARGAASPTVAAAAAPAVMTCLREGVPMLLGTGGAPF